MTLRQIYTIVLRTSKGGFTRRAKAGDDNQQTADDVKSAIPLPFTRTR